MSNKVPKIRFNGYSEAWVQRNLSEVATITGGSTPSTSNPEYWDGDINWFAPAEIGNQTYVTESSKKISELGLQKSSAKILPVGTILFTSRAGIGKTAILASEASTNQGFQSIVPGDTLDSYFVYSLTDKLARYGNKMGSGSTFDEISGKQLGKYPITMPEIEEQVKIGNLFKNLDNLIAANQRKLDLLKEQKKGYLQKMFPKNGAKVPELRFAGFADDWEERKFGELYKKVNEKNDLSFGKDKVISVANMYFKDTGNIRSDDAYMKTYNIFRMGDIAFEGNRSKHFSYGRFVENTIGDGIVSHVFDVFRPIQQFDLNYWKYAIHNERVMGPILMTATTSSTMMTNLVAKDFLKRAILVPSYSEQKLVGSFFKQLDDTIALHQRKLDLLREQKKGLLQKMYV
ncbi:restriction endonuclease subunit S [Weissella confusa]|uniref:restriction endonuclease subunit S n=1 Tax=Weissella confusa TaxID=1583 RepID=UPI0021AFAB87|nr:restriction endonuclease subunit S [Weissella confusa]MCT0950064.1 restriction endonuclease subunit S [Weissella confusa]